MRTYYLGNSTLGGFVLEKLDELAKIEGEEYIYGAQLSAAATLDKHWNKEGQINHFESENFNFGNYDSAFTNYDWDAVILEPYSNQLENIYERLGDVESFQNFINFAKGKGEDVEFYSYAIWPRKHLDPNNPDRHLPFLDQILNPENFLPFNYQEMWDRTYVPQDKYSSYQSRDYHYQLLERVNENNPDLEEPVKMIPMGDVFYELDKRIKNGEIPGLNPSKGVEQLYVDQIHLNPLPHKEPTLGNFIVAITTYATLFKTSPFELNSSESLWGINDPVLVDKIYDVVWDVVSGHPYTGINEVTEPNEPTVPNNPDKNIINGTSENNQLYGTDGEDIIKGLEGNDRLEGKEGNDTLEGGMGNDTLDGGSGADTFIFNSPEEGYDVITNTFNRVDGDRIEINVSGFGGGLVAGGFLSSELFVLGTKATNSNHRFIYDNSKNHGEFFYDVDGVGGLNQKKIASFVDGPELTFNDIYLVKSSEDNEQILTEDELLKGLEGNERLEGKEGNDTLEGGMGNDTLDGGSGADTFIFNSPEEGYDVITKTFNRVDGDKIEINASGFGGGLLAGGVLSSELFVLGTIATDPNHRFIYDNSKNHGEFFYDVDGVGGLNQKKIASFVDGPELTFNDIYLV